MIFLIDGKIFKDEHSESKEQYEDDEREFPNGLKSIYENYHINLSREGYTYDEIQEYLR